MKFKRRIEKAFTVTVGVVLVDDPKALVQFKDGSCCVYVEQTDPDAWEDDYYEFETLEQGLAHYEKHHDEPVPNWELQAEYDEMHGTINGRDPGVVAYEEAFPYGD